MNSCIAHRNQYKLELYSKHTGCSRIYWGGGYDFVAIMNISIIENTTMVTDGTLLDWVTLDRIGIIIGIVVG